MHGSLNAQSYVRMQNKPNRLGCYIYNRTKIELFCKHATQYFQRNSKCASLTKNTAFDLYWRKNKPKFVKNILDK